VNTSSDRLFDNVRVQARAGRLALWTVRPPHLTLYWPDAGAVLSELGLAQSMAEALGEPQAQVRFLEALVSGPVKDDRLRPARIGYDLSPDTVRRSQEHRRQYRLVTFVGACARRVVLAGLEAAAGQARRGGTIDMVFTHWDALSDWAAGRERVSEACAYAHQNLQLNSRATLFSELRELPPGLWEFVYDNPGVRIAWVVGDRVGGSREGTGSQRGYGDSAPFRNLREISDQGLWPHMVLPVTGANVRALPELVLALVDATRGGSIELAPVGLLPKAASRLNVAGCEGTNASGPLAPALSPLNGEGECGPVAGEYVEALLAMYRNPRIPLRLISPLSWVAARMDSEQPPVSSPAGAGAALAVLSNGDLYAGENAIGCERWRLGNVLENPDSIKWERLDVMAESLSSATKPKDCQLCDWRYLCGGVDASVLLLEEKQNGESKKQKAESRIQNPGGGADAAVLFDLYCAPRKRLFEELMWDSAEAAAKGQNRPGRERVELREDGIDFTPVNHA